MDMSAPQFQRDLPSERFILLARALMDEVFGEIAPLLTPDLHGPALPDAQIESARGELAAHPHEPDIGWLYQFSIPADRRSELGAFYTPEALVQLMLDRAGLTGPAARTGRVVDPACGAGAFLIEAARRMAAQGQVDGLGAAEILSGVADRVVGLDVSETGILLCEVGIWLALRDLVLEASRDSHWRPPVLQLHVTDSLDIEADDEARPIKTRAGDFVDGFAWVIANPPYAKITSSRLSAAQAEHFSPTLYGHPNLYGMFLQLGVELLAPGGHLVYVNPMSFVSGRYFHRLRAWLRERLDFESFDVFSSRSGLFDGVQQEVVVISATRADGQRSAIRLREFDAADLVRPVREIETAAGSVLLPASMDHSMLLTADARVHELLDRMLDGSTPLAQSGLRVFTGQVVWNRVKDRLRDQPDPGSLPLMWSNAIRPFTCGQPGNRQGDATHLLLDAKTSSMLCTGPALLVKRLTSKEEHRRLVACRLGDDLAASPEGYFVENHVNVIQAGPDADLDLLDCALGILNSRLMDCVFAAMNGNTQVSATELRWLPMPRDVASVARAVRAGLRDDELERAVERAYGI
jgi:adenine-specific DNA-methyltransferase